MKSNDYSRCVHLIKVYRSKFFFQLKDTDSSKVCTDGVPCESEQDQSIIQRLLSTMTSFLFEEEDDSETDDKDIDLHESLDLGDIFYEWLFGESTKVDKNKARRGAAAGKHNPSQSFKAHKRKDGDDNEEAEQHADGESDSFFSSVISTVISILSDNGSSGVTADEHNRH